MLADAERAILVWSMGVTQHERGEDNVRAIVNLALARGFVGREGCGLMPIRGHSGVQGGAEMGCYATAFPGRAEIGPETAAELAAHWGFEVPSEPGLTAPEMIDAAGRGELDLLFSVGGNFLEVLPDPERVRAALGRIPLRVHMDIVGSSQMLVEPAADVLLLPATTRYEVPGGVTETSTERRVIFSPEIEGQRIEAARPEWEVLGEVAARARPELAERVRFSGTEAIREEIARVVPLYRGIEELREQGDQFQYGGAHLCAGWEFPTADGRARFAPLTVPEPVADDGLLALCDPAREAVQLDGPGAPRLAHRRDSRGRPDQRRGRRAARDRRRRPGRRPLGAGRAARGRDAGADRTRQRPGPLARGQRAARRPPLAGGGDPRLQRPSQR